MENSKQIYVLALDVGTSSVRASIFDQNAERLPETVVKKDRQLHLTEDGGAEIDAEEALAQVIEAIEEVCHLAPEIAAKVDFVATSCFWHSLVGIDENGKAITPIFGWADTRSKKYVETLRTNFDENETHNRTGCRFHSSYWTTKLLWLKTEQPEIFQRVTRWLSFSDFIALRFFGESITSVSMASGTGIFDIRQNIWFEKLLDFTGISIQNLPKIEDEERFSGKLTSEFALKFPLLENAKWLLAIGDGAANNVGANCMKSDKAALMIGTSGAMRVAYEGLPPENLPSGLFCYRIDKKRLLVGGALSDGGGLYHWLKETFKLSDIDKEIEGEISMHRPDSHGLTFLPFLAGERSTGYNANAHGAILGLTQHTTAVEIAQAALESVAYRFAEISDQLNQIFEIREITASGGALRESRLWTQIIADVLKQKLILPEAREASSRGVVLLALEIAGQFSNIADLPMPKGVKFDFNQGRNSIYQEARKRHEHFYELLIK